jgi:dihydrofolate synthase/folylpolyglutamate synthase
VSVITSISFDHTKQLGNTLSEIAREKAGIIKPGVPVVSGVTDPQAKEVIAEVARQHGCRLIQSGRDFQFRYYPAREFRQGDKETRRQGEEEHFSLSPCLPVSPSIPLNASIDYFHNVPGQEHELLNVPLAMRGPHQAANAAVALASVAELRHQGWCLSVDAMRLGMSQAALPGRVEVIAADPTIVLDTAHNAASARALVESLAEFSKAGRRTVLLSISRDKDARAIVQELAPHFDRFVVTQYQENPRAIPAETLAEIVSDVMADRVAEMTVVADPTQAWQFIRQTTAPAELVCITGSFFLAAELRRLASGM